MPARCLARCRTVTGRVTMQAENAYGKNVTTSRVTASPCGPKEHLQIPEPGEIHSGKGLCLPY